MFMLSCLSFIKIYTLPNPYHNRRSRATECSHIPPIYEPAFPIPLLLPRFPTVIHICLSYLDLLIPFRPGFHKHVSLVLK